MMRKLIQKKATGAFWTRDGKWAKDWRRARIFKTYAEPVEAAQRYNLAGVTLYYLFGDEISELDFTIPLAP